MGSIPTWVDLCTLAGSFGLFFTLFLLFCRFLPVVAMAEVKTVMPQAHVHGGHTPDDAAAPITVLMNTTTPTKMPRGLRTAE